MRPFKFWLGLGAVVLAASAAFPSNHREAPITALDHKADITDVYAFVSYAANHPPGAPGTKVTLILSVDPLLEPGNGPTLFPFDPGILYEIHVDNDRDARPDVSFQFRFFTEYQIPGLFTAAAGFSDMGRTAPGVPPRIADFENPGLNLRQTYRVTMVRGRHKSELENGDGSPFFVVPGNVGPRTMDYEALFDRATYHLADSISVFAGTTDDAFWIDLGGAFDTLNLRTLGSGVPGVLTDAEDQAKRNFASDFVSGYAVNSIAIEVPIEMLTSTGAIEPADSPQATVGVWGTTSRQAVTIRRSPNPEQSIGSWRQVQRMGNPLVNELLIGIGFKDRFSMDKPRNDSQFASFFLDPVLAQVASSLYGVLVPGALAVPPAPRNDLLPLVTYPGANAGPIADLLRLNTGVPPTPIRSASRLGLIAGDNAGFPNGRRVFDDVTDIALRVVVGGVLIPDFNKFPNNRLGDGVNVNDTRYRTDFPYLGSAPSGRNRRHKDPGEKGGGPVS
ncbi:MAG: DUF4331 domain-containing protein [Vicinamibacteria bacterium]